MCSLSYLFKSITQRKQQNGEVPMGTRKMEGWFTEVGQLSV